MRSNRLGICILTAIFFLVPAIDTHVALGANTASCMTQLKRIATLVPPKKAKGRFKACRVTSPVSLTLIKSPAAQITMRAGLLNKCSFALQFSQWMADAASPLARKHLGSAIVSVRSGPGFVCRRRNNSRTGKLSEHALGNAIDISGFGLANGKDFNINLPRKLTAKEARFLAALRKSACAYFTTVLGPGSNRAHATHLHLDLQRHGKAGTYRVCQ